jgi:hypothetical protein
MSDLATRKTLAKSALNGSQALYNNLNLITGSQRMSISQQTQLQNTLKDLKAEMAQVQQEADAYDREFLDRKNAGEGAYTSAERHGLNTLQDWTLLYFFGSIGLATLIMVIFAWNKAPNRLYGILIVLAISSIITLLTASILMKIG